VIGGLSGCNSVDIAFEVLELVLAYFCKTKCPSATCVPVLPGGAVEFGPSHDYPLGLSYP
jgi:hypothetical protein